MKNGLRIWHILPENLRFDAHRSNSTPALRCSVFSQTALKSEGCKLPSAVPYKFIYVLLLTLLISLGLSGGRARAITPTQIPSTYKTQISAYDKTTTANLYWVTDWISQAGFPANDSVITVPYGTTSVALQVQGMIFLHHNLVNVDSRTYAGLPNDGKPNSTAQNGDLVNRSYINSITATGGTISGGAGQTLTKGYTSTTRYWFTSALGITYNSGTPLTASKTIDITMNYTQINNYHGNPSDSYCVADNGLKATSQYPPANCSSTPVTFHITINVTPPPSLDGVKIDNSGLGTYGGNCANVTLAGSCTGTLANYPFSDDKISATYYSNGAAAGSVTTNPFYFSTSHGNQLSATSYRLSLTAAGTADTGWTLIGYSFCDSTSPPVGGCTTAYLVAPANMHAIAYGQTTGSIILQNAHSYHFRWIFKQSVTASCGVMTPTNLTSPGSPIQPGDSYSITVNIYNSPAFSGGTFKLSDNFGNGYAANFTIPETPSSQTGPTITSGSSPTGTAGAAADYSVFWSFYNSANVAIVTNCPGTLSVVDLPYMRVYGSSVSSGGDFDCATGDLSHAGILGGWYNNGAPLAGASSQFSATALGQIAGFASSENSQPTPPLGLTFANDIAAPPADADYSAALGGNFGGQHCLFNPESPDSANAVSASGSPFTVDSGALGDGAHELDAGSIQLAGGSITPTHNVSVFVPGDVYIGGNITFNASLPWNLTDKKVPSFVLVATGNIYISPGVTRLDGIYVANGGKIYTCGNSTFTPVDAASLYATCNKQLVISGAFIANQVNFMRTLGTLREATAGETPSSATRACTNNGGVNYAVCAGEVFDFSPELYLGNPAIQLPSQGAVQYDAISALPPVL